MPDTSPVPENSVAIKFVNLSILNALGKKATEIFYIVKNGEFRIYCVLNGVRTLYLSPPLSIQDSCFLRLKIMARVSVEPNIPHQEGEILLKLGRRRNVRFKAVFDNTPDAPAAHLTLLED